MNFLTLDQIAATIEKARHAILSRANTTPISERQQASLKDPGAQGSSWVSRVRLTAPQCEENDVQRLLLDAIEALGRGDEQFILPPMRDVEAQWTGYRPGVGPKEPEPSIPEGEKYDCLMKDTENQTTMFYIQGGAFVLNTPARFRNTTTKLAELTKGRCFSIGYRLAPQHPFPAALLDVIISYLSLLYPSQGSYHSPVPASSIVLAGDSSGACLALALVQVILAARHAQATHTPTVRFHDQTVVLSMPCGLAVQSPSLDQTNSLPSWYRDAAFDLLQETSPVMLPTYPSCPIWPSNPPRGDIYCETSMLCHPLVSPTAARSWAGAPPMWIAMGEERLGDGAKVVAQTAASQGVAVRWESYKAMPHNWPMLIPGWWQSTRCMKRWAEACTLFTQGKHVKTRAEEVDVGCAVRDINVRELIGLGPEEAEKLMRVSQAATKPWTGGSANAKL